MPRIQSAKVLGGLHCFECIARLGSFSRAAHELCLTPSAVSHRIRVLEAELGFSLFHRYTRRIALTEEGRRLISLLQRSLGELDMEIQTIQTRELHGSLYVTCPVSWLSCWLVPRIPRFRALYPGIELHLRGQMNLVDFENERADMAIYYGTGRHPRLHVELLMDECLFPVCTPAYATLHKLWNTPEALSECLLLHDITPWGNAREHEEWKLWLGANGQEDFSFTAAYTFDRSELALDMAALGDGVAMGRRRLAEVRLIAGTLIRPFEAVQPSPCAYWCVMPVEQLHNVRIAAFCTWLRHEVAASPAIPAFLCKS